jgi:ABC-type glycerol-3-phosphate transport system permease component
MRRRCRSNRAAVCHFSAFGGDALPAQGALPVPTPLAAIRTGLEWWSGLAGATTATTAGTTSLLPIIVLFLFLQRFFVEGVAGAVTQ